MLHMAIEKVDSTLKHGNVPLCQRLPEGHDAQPMRLALEVSHNEMIGKPSWKMGKS